MPNVTIEETMSLIKARKVFWIVETPHGCSFIRLRNEEYYCFVPNDYDLHVCMLENNFSTMIDGTIIEDQTYCDHT